MQLSASSAVRVGVFGASGTTGTELVSLVVGHPRCALGFATSREYAEQSLRKVDPAAPDVRLTDPGKVRFEDVDVAFSCLPHGASAEVVELCYRRGLRVIDLSGDLRLRDHAEHDRVYGSARSRDVAETSVYGLTEFRRDQVVDAPIIANPGCYPTCSVLALAPLAQQGLLSGPVVINALSGVSGAGRGAKPDTHFCAVYNDAKPYKLGREHRHAAEIDQTIGALLPAAKDVPDLLFCPHVIPIERGMLATVSVTGCDLAPEQAHELYMQAYRDEAFVEVLPQGEAARIRAAIHTNRAVIGVHGASGRDRHLVITCAIDNLVKGAAGQALQNMNLMFGLPETLGLERGVSGGQR
jgi:N-acetyl-gamma-glutamyl-phosphate reductase